MNKKGLHWEKMAAIIIVIVVIIVLVTIISKIYDFKDIFLKMFGG